MSLQTRLAALIAAVGGDVKDLLSRSLPAGGVEGQVLAKASATSYDTAWVDRADGVIPIDPATLFANGELGAWYEAGDLDTLFQDDGASNALETSAPDQAVGLRLDKSRSLLRGDNVVPDADGTWTLNSAAVTVIPGGFRFTNAAALNAATNVPAIPLVNAGTYEVSFTVSGYVSGGVRLIAYADNLFSNGNADVVTADGVYTQRIRLINATGTVQQLRVQAVNGPNITLDVTGITLREIAGSHGAQATSTARPLLRNSGSVYWLEFDGVDDALVTTFGSTLGSDCTIARAIPGVGAQILTAQTIDTTFTDDVTASATLVVNRALTDTETAQLAAYLEAVSGMSGTTDALPEGASNKYFTDERVRAALPPGYIDGLQVVWVSGTALTVTSGSAYIEGDAGVLESPAAIAKAGLSLSASTWYHVYLFDNAGTPDIEIVTTAPVVYNGVARSKTADTSRRYLGSVLTDGAGAIYNFRHEAASGDVFYLERSGSAPFRILSLGKVGSSTVVSAAGAIPESASVFYARLVNTAGASGNPIAFMSNPDAHAAVTQSDYIISIAPGIDTYSYVTTSAARQINYFVFNPQPSGGFYIDLTGYIYRR